MKTRVSAEGGATQNARFMTVSANYFDTLDVIVPHIPRIQTIHNRSVNP